MFIKTVLFIGLWVSSVFGADQCPLREVKPLSIAQFHHAIGKLKEQGIVWYDIVARSNNRNLFGNPEELFIKHRTVRVNLVEESLPSLRGANKRLIFMVPAAYPLSASEILERIVSAFGREHIVSDHLATNAEQAQNDAASGDLVYMCDEKKAALTYQESFRRPVTEYLELER